jgi:hypothetical protein
MSDDYTRASSPLVGSFETVADLARRSGVEPPTDQAEGRRLPVLLRMGRELYTYEEWENCKAHLEACQEAIHVPTMIATHEIADMLAQGEVDLVEADRLVTAISQWSMKATMQCRCRPAQGDLPEIPDWKGETRNVLGQDRTWRDIFQATVPVTTVAGLACGAAVAYMGFPGAVAVEVARRWGPPLVVAAGVGAILAFVSDQLAKDPPDDDFAELPVVDLKPRFDIDLSDLPEESQEAVTHLIDLGAEQASVGFALLTAVQRSWGAEVAGDQEASTQQLEAAANLAERLADAVEGQVAARAALVAAVRVDLPTLIVSQKRLLEVVLPTLVEGPNETFEQVVSHYGDGNQDAEQLWWLMSAQLFNGAVPGEWLFPDELSPPALSLAEAREAAYLRSITEVWRA